MVTTDGNYSFENLSEGLYTIYAISDPSDGTPNLHSYNGDELFWGNSSEININQSLTDINIKLEQYTSAPAGNGSISGHIIMIQKILMRRIFMIIAGSVLHQ